MKISMIATKPHRYGARSLRSGDTFEVEGSRDAKLLAALGRAKEITAVPVEPARPVPAIEAAEFKARRPMDAPSKQVPAVEAAAPAATPATPEAAKSAPSPHKAPDAAVPAPSAPGDSAVGGLSSSPQRTRDGGYDSAAIEAEDKSGGQDKPKRTYKRRDLTAEDHE